MWSCICRSTRRLLVVKAYLKRKMRKRHHQNVRRELSILSAATADRFGCSLCWRACSECLGRLDVAGRRTLFEVQCHTEMTDCHGMTHCYEQATEGGWGNLQAPACLTRALAWDSCRTSAWESPADCAGSCWWCRCPGVVGFLGSFEDGQHICLVQEHCAKGDLFKALLRQGGAMPEHRVCTEVSFCCSLQPSPTWRRCGVYSCSGSNNG